MKGLLLLLTSLLHHELSQVENKKNVRRNTFRTSLHLQEQSSPTESLLLVISELPSLTVHPIRITSN